MDADVIIIGAGASGLIAARELSRKKKKVIVLEARDRIGGRIYSQHGKGFYFPIETGAEFIHGNLPLTFKLLNEYKLQKTEITGGLWQHKKGKLVQEYDFIEEGKELEKKLEEVKEDVTVEEFLNTHFREEKYTQLKQSVTRFVEGYDAADIKYASTLAFKEEWLAEEPWKQYRPAQQYDVLMNSIAKECIENGVEFFLSAAAQKISYAKDNVMVAASDRKFSASRIIITVPLGVLRADKESKAFIDFDPPLPDPYRNAINKLGYGGVIKFILQFKAAFWKDAPTGELKDMGFLFSDTEKIPTWWTQDTCKLPLLTGWMAGKRSEHFLYDNEEDLLHKAIETLARLLKREKDFIKEQLSAHKIIDWNKDEYALGAYSYSVVNGTEMIETLAAPVEQTLYFAGEALNADGSIATVEAALQSGLKTAKLVLKE